MLPVSVTRAASRGLPLVAAVLLLVSCGGGDGEEGNRPEISPTRTPTASVPSLGLPSVTRSPGPTGSAEPPIITRSSEPTESAQPPIINRGFDSTGDGGTWGGFRARVCRRRQRPGLGVVVAGRPGARVRRGHPADRACAATERLAAGSGRSGG